MSERKKVYHYCSGEAHEQCRTTDTLVMTEQPPAEFGDYPMLEVYRIPIHLMEGLGGGLYRVRGAVARSFPHASRRVTFWHVCDPESHAACAASEWCRIEISPERLEHQVVFRIHLPERVDDGAGFGRSPIWVETSATQGLGYYQVAGRTLAEAVLVDGKVIQPAVDPDLVVA